MTHLVKYTKSDGQTGEHETEELQDAIAHVERLRNDEGVDSARIFRIEEIAFEFKPYYRVELGGSVAAAPGPSESPAAPATVAGPTSAPAPDVAAEGPAAEAASANGDAPPVIDPWADAPPPPAPAAPAPATPAGSGSEAGAEGEPVSTGRRGLFSR